MKKKLPKFDVNSGFFYAGLVLCLVSVVLLLGAFRLSQDRTSSVSLPAGQTVSQGSAALTLESVRSTAGSGHYKAPTGKKYIIISLRVENRSTTPIMVAPASDTYLKDSAGTTYYLSPTSLEEPFHSGQLLPGDRVRGELSYLVPEKSDARLFIEADWTGGVVPFLLQ